MLIFQGVSIAFLGVKHWRDKSTEAAAAPPKPSLDASPRENVEASLPKATSLGDNRAGEYSMMLHVFWANYSDRKHDLGPQMVV